MVLVSFCIPTYNSQRFISECLYSVLNQDYENLEIILSDNDSTDNTINICEKILNEHPRRVNYQIIKNEHNLGPVLNWLNSIEAAKGEYVKLLFSDDLILPNFTNETLTFLLDAQVGLAYTGAFCGESISQSKLISYIDKQISGKIPSSFFVYKGLFEGKSWLGYGIPCSPTCAIFRKKDIVKALKQIINLSESERLSITNGLQHGAGLDMLIYLFIAEEYSYVAHVPKPLTLCRAQNKSISFTESSKSLEKFSGFYLLARKYFFINVIAKKYSEENIAIWCMDTQLEMNKFVSRYCPIDTSIKSFEFKKLSKSSAHKISVVLDISVLGLGTLLETAKTGVFRVTEYLLKGLIKSSNCQVYLCTSIPDLFDACQNYIHENLLDVNICLFQLSDLQYQDIDVYHSTYYPLPNSIYSATRIITVYDLIPILFPEYFNYNSDHIIKNTIDSIGRNDLICCISKSTKQDIYNYRTDISQEKLLVTYLAADNNKFYPCNDQKLINQTKEKYNIPNQPYLLSLSTLEPRKNIAHVIICFLKLIKEQHINDLNLVLVGTKGWQYEEIFAEIDENQELQNRIIVTGYVPDEDLAPLYSGALAFLYLSLYEGFGLPPLEAMQCGTPVITSNTSSLPEVVEDAGIMLDPHDEKGLCDAIFKLYSDPEYRENLAGKSVQQAQKFSWDKYIEETIKIYEVAKETSKNLPPRNILIDGVFFQLLKTGIARVWKSLLEEWANTEFADHILVLDRANTAPKINGIRYRTIHPYDYNNTAADKQMLQQICKEEGADLFISSYYTTPITTPSVFMAYDMIPEVMGANVNEPMWREKHHAIKHASAYIAISQNTASDLSKYFPNIAVQSITVAHCGVSNTFSPAKPLQINTFKHRYGINKPYFLLAGSLTDYKNQILFLKAYSKLPNSYEFDIIFTGFGGVFPPELRDYTSGSAVHQLRLSDEELRLAYSGAVALVYPSKYEGFGMPIVEAMACGCPVITCPNSSIPEVAGEAAIYVNDNDVDAMANALISVQNHNLRTSLITAGLAQAQKFSWTKMATQVSSALINTTLLSLKLRDINLIIFPDPTQSEQSIYQDLIKVITALEEHPHSDNITLLINASNFSSQFTQAFMDNLCNQEEEETAGLEISLVGKLSSMQWQTLLPQITARIVLTQEDQQTLEKLPVHQLSSCQVDNLNEQLSILLTESLKQNLRLRDINLIIFPDPTQPEQSIYQDLVNVITALEEHPHSDNITLLINASNFSSQFTQAFMDNLCNQEEEETAGLEISLVGKLSSIQWEALLPQITARIVLNNEDQQALEQVQLEKLTSYQLDNLEDVLKVADGVSNIYRSP